MNEKEKSLHIQKLIRDYNQDIKHLKLLSPNTDKKNNIELLIDFFEVFNKIRINVNHKVASLLV